MKNIFYSILLITTTLLFNHCTDENKPIFIADLSSEEITFKNSFSDEYLLSEETKENIADRFIWNETTLGTNNDYELQGAINPSFVTHTVIGMTNATNYTVFVKQLLDFAQQLGLDNNPITTDNGGVSNNIGIVYFRVKASIGNGGAGTEEIFSETQSIKIVWIEQEAITDEACSSVWAVGSAITDVGWDFTNAVEFTCENNVYSTRLKLQNDGSNLLSANNFRLFTTKGDWATGTLGYKYYSDANYTIDANFRSAEDSDANFNFTGTSGIYNMVIDENTKIITLEKSPSYLMVGALLMQQLP